MVVTDSMLIRSWRTEHWIRWVLPDVIYVLINIKEKKDGWGDNITHGSGHCPPAALWLPKPAGSSVLDPLPPPWLRALWMTPTARVNGAWGRTGEITTVRLASVWHEQWDSPRAIWPPFPFPFKFCCLLSGRVTLVCIRYSFLVSRSGLEFVGYAQSPRPLL